MVEWAIFEYLIKNWYLNTIFCIVLILIILKILEWTVFFKIS